MPRSAWKSEIPTPTDGGSVARVHGWTERLNPKSFDYQQFENSIRDKFNIQTTSFCRWNSEQIEIISPEKHLNVSFSWTQKINYASFNETRDHNVTVRLELRKINGQWLIRKDLDGKLFANDYGPLPAAPQ